MRVCPCVYCQADSGKGEPLRLARWRDTKRWWAPFGHDCVGEKGTPDRERAHLFGPRHAAVLRANPHFQVLVPRIAKVGRRHASKIPALTSRSA